VHVLILNNFQKPSKFRNELTILFLEIHQISPVELKQIFMTLIDTITNLIANEIREVSHLFVHFLNYMFL